MNRNGLVSTAFTTFVFMGALAAAWPMQAQDAKSPYPNMAPVDQYLMERNAEIALARSAAPESISRDAEVMVLGRKGYEIAVKGKNGFVCLVHRSWASEAEDPEFWNPRRRGPMCLNPQAARSYLPNTIMRTNLVLAGRSEVATDSFSLQTRGLRPRLDQCRWPAYGLLFARLPRDRSQQ